MITHALKAIRWYFMWRIRSVASESGVDDAALNDIRENRARVIDELEQVISQRPADEVKIQVFHIIKPLNIGYYASY